LIFVNDGSPDNALEVALDLHRQDPHVVVDLSRNFGHHKAIMTGLMQARGEKVFLIDCDLEEAPETAEHLPRRNAKDWRRRDFWPAGSAQGQMVRANLRLVFLPCA